MLAPYLPLVRARTRKPGVLDAGPLQHRMSLLAHVQYEVFRSAAYPEQLYLPVGFFRIRERPLRGVQISDSAADNADPLEFIQVRYANAHRLAAAHGKSSDGSMLGVGNASETAVDEGN